MTIIGPPQSVPVLRNAREINTRSLDKVNGLTVFNFQLLNADIQHKVLIQILLLEAHVLYSVGK